MEEPGRPRRRYERYLLAGISPTSRPLSQIAYANGARIHSELVGRRRRRRRTTTSARQLDRFVWDAQGRSASSSPPATTAPTRTATARINPMQRQPAGHREELHHRRGVREPATRKFDSETYGDVVAERLPGQRRTSAPMADESPIRWSPSAAAGRPQDGRVRSRRS